MENELNVYEARNQPFYIAQQKQDNTFSMHACHYHNIYEIYYLVEGRRNYFIQNRTYPVVKGDIVLINVHDIHKTMNSHHASHERILIYFQKEFLSCIMQQDEKMNLLQCFLSDQKVIHLNVSEQAFVQSILLKMVDEDRRKPCGHVTYQRILLAELLLFINRHMEQFKQESNAYNSQLHRKMSEVALYLMENYMNHLSLKLVAEKFYITPCHLSRAFKKTSGFTFIEYLNNIRIKEAQKLLKETRKSVMQISELTGFDSQTHFGRVFKGITGLSPLQYRKKP
ncbi:MAG: AraC family transcriptional regulator [Ruminiclostridium sp.]|nr:AraC family transcriptional regulator [Ruminiclostridium sp.]